MSSDERPTMPFGDADGSQVEPTHVVSDFVNFSNVRSWGALATSPSDFDARIFVGRKGSGKTIYLRRHASHAAGRKELAACPLENDPPSTAEIQRFVRWSESRPQRLESWRKFWSKAIIVAHASHLLYDRRHEGAVSEPHRSEIATQLDSLLDQGPVRVQLGVYAAAKLLLAQSGGRSDIERILHSPRWATLHQAVQDVVPNVAPVLMFLDNIDEHYQVAPNLWIECEIGFFLSLIDLTRSHQFIRSPKIFATIREEVYSAVLRQNEHRTRISGDSHVRLLEWTRESILHFFRQKIDRLDHEWLSRPDAENDFERWLGATEATNGRSELEPMEQYVVRHTRLTPRDVIMIGNNISDHIRRQTQRGAGREFAIRNGVSAASADFGLEQLSMVASRIVADWTIVDPSRQTANAVADRDSTQFVSDHVIKALRQTRRDRFRKRAMFGLLERLGSLVAPDDGIHVHPIDHLWMAGMIGYVEPLRGSASSVRFYSLSTHALELSRDMSEYGLHSIVHELVRLEAVNPPVLQE